MLSRIKQKILSYKKLETIESVSESAAGTLDKLSNVITGMNHFIKHLQTILGAIPWTSTIAVILNSMLQAISALSTNKSSLSRRASKLTVALCALGLGITSLIITPLAIPLLIASSAVDTANKAWEVIKAIKSRFFGSWKTESLELKKLKKELHQTLSDFKKSNSLGTNLSAAEKNEVAK